MRLALFNEMLCSSLMLHGLAELAISVFVLVHRRGASAISRIHNLRGTRCSVADMSSKRFLLVSLSSAKCALWRSCFCSSNFLHRRFWIIMVFSVVGCPFGWRSVASILADGCVARRHVSRLCLGGSFVSRRRKPRFM